MKRMATIAAALLLLTGATAFAQGFPGGGPGRGGRAGGMGAGMMMGGAMMRPQPETDPDLIATYTDYMADKLKLSDGQRQQFAELNKQYTGKVMFPIPFEMKEKIRKEKASAEGPQAGQERRRGRGNDETAAAIDSAASEMRRNFRNMENMTETQRQEMMQQMQERMEEARAKAEEMEELQDEYNDALKAILDERQTKAYRKELRREEEREERRLQGEMRRRMQRGGFGGPGGGPGGFGGRR